MSVYGMSNRNGSHLYLAVLGTASRHHEPSHKMRRLVFSSYHNASRCEVFDMSEMSPVQKFLLYKSDDEDVAISAAVKDETIWLTQEAMAELFGIKIPAISRHLSNIFDEGELSPEATVFKMEIVQAEGGREVKRIVSRRSSYARRPTMRKITWA